MPVESLKPPRIVKLEDMPKPQVVEVPETAAGTYEAIRDNQRTTVDLLPPTVKPAGFLSIMQSYTSNEGLSIDSVSGGCVDRFVGDL